ncbi:MAG: hypothetical protein ACPGYK_10710 [Flavobacteriales bacterium]
MKKALFDEHPDHRVATSRLPTSRETSAWEIGDLTKRVDQRTT